MCLGLRKLFPCVALLKTHYHLTVLDIEQRLQEDVEWLQGRAAASPNHSWLKYGCDQPHSTLLCGSAFAQLWANKLCGPEGAAQCKIKKALALSLLSCGFCRISQSCFSMGQPLYTRVRANLHVPCFSGGGGLQTAVGAVSYGNLKASVHMPCLYERGVLH